MNLTRGIRFFWLLGLVLLLATALGAGWVLNQPASGTGPSQTGEAVGIVCQGYGDVDGGVALLNPAQPGRVESVWVQEGDTVHEGDLLISFDNRVAHDRLKEADADLAAAVSALHDAETLLPKKWQADIDIQKKRIEIANDELEVSQENLKVHKKLYADKQISDEQLAVEQNKVKIAEGKVEAEKKGLIKVEASDPKGTIERAREDVKAKQARRDMARIAYVECDLYAPADGIVLRLFATPGEWVAPGTPQRPAIQFCPAKARIVRVEVLQEWASKVAKGQVAYIEDDTRVGTQWKGKVVRVSEWFTHRRSILQEPFQYNDIRTLECIVLLDADSRPVRIGQRVRVTLKPN
jgi:multidrug resistance efflux pump